MRYEKKVYSVWSMWPWTVIFLCIALLSSNVYADANLRQAKKYYSQGQKYYRLGNFEQALTAFTQAYKFKPRPGFLFNMGQCHKKLKNYEKAVHFYNGFLRKRPNDRKAFLA